MCLSASLHGPSGSSRITALCSLPGSWRVAPSASTEHIHILSKTSLAVIGGWLLSAIARFRVFHSSRGWKSSVNEEHILCKKAVTYIGDILWKWKKWLSDSCRCEDQSPRKKLPHLRQSPRASTPIMKLAKVSDHYNIYSSLIPHLDKLHGHRTPCKSTILPPSNDEMIHVPMLWY